MNTRDIKELQKRITTLHKNEHLEILKIIREDPIKYTENNNGIFLNMVKLQPLTIQKIQTLVDFCSQNSQLLEKERLKRETIRDMVEKEIQSSTKDNIAEEGNEVTTEPSETLELNLEQWTLDKDYMEQQQHIKTVIDDKSNLATYRKTPKFTGAEARIIKKSRDNSTLEKK